MNTLTITEEDIYDKLCNLKTDKSPGLDMIHPRVLFEMRDVINNNNNNNNDRLTAFDPGQPG